MAFTIEELQEFFEELEDDYSRESEQEQGFIDRVDRQYTKHVLDQLRPIFKSDNPDADFRVFFVDHWPKIQGTKFAYTYGVQSYYDRDTVALRDDTVRYFPEVYELLFAIVDHLVEGKRESPIAVLMPGVESPTLVYNAVNNVSAESLEDFMLHYKDEPKQDTVAMLAELMNIKDAFANGIGVEGRNAYEVSCDVCALMKLADSDEQRVEMLTEHQVAIKLEINKLSKDSDGDDYLIMMTSGFSSETTKAFYNLFEDELMNFGMSQDVNAAAVAAILTPVKEEKKVFLLSQFNRLKLDSKGRRLVPREISNLLAICRDDKEMQPEIYKTLIEEKGHVSFENTDEARDLFSELTVEQSVAVYLNNENHLNGLKEPREKAATNVSLIKPELQQEVARGILQSKLQTFLDSSEESVSQAVEEKRPSRIKWYSRFIGQSSETTPFIQQGTDRNSINTAVTALINKLTPKQSVAEGEQEKLPLDGQDRDLLLGNKKTTKILESFVKHGFASKLVKGKFNNPKGFINALIKSGPIETQTQTATTFTS